MDKIEIRNKAGVLHIEIERKISLRDAMYGRGDDKLPSFTRPRLEFHTRANGDKLVTLFDQANEFPSKIYLFFIDGAEVKAYIGRMDRDEREDEAFITVNGA